MVSSGWYVEGGGEDEGVMEEAERVLGALRLELLAGMT